MILHTKKCRLYGHKLIWPDRFLPFFFFFWSKLIVAIHWQFKIFCQKKSKNSFFNWSRILHISVALLLSFPLYFLFTIQKKRIIFEHVFCFNQITDFELVNFCAYHWLKKKKESKSKSRFFFFSVKLTNFKVKYFLLPSSYLSLLCFLFSLLQKKKANKIKKKITDLIFTLQKNKKKFFNFFSCGFLKSSLFF